MTRFPFRALSIRAFGLVLFATVTLGTAGCEDKHIGRLCDVGMGAGGASGTNGQFNNQALECPSRICIQPTAAGMVTTDTGALCSATCESDDDCSDAEVRPANTTDPLDKRCRRGFKCRRLLPGLSTNPLACKRLCVCEDFLPTGDTGVGNPAGCNGDNRE